MTFSCCPFCPRSLVPTLRVGTQAGPLRGPAGGQTGRRASQRAFPRGAREREGFGIWLVVLFSLALVASCHAQAPASSDGAPVDPRAYGRRTDAFRRLLFELNFQPVLSFGDLEFENPSESMFIMLGDPTCLNRRNFEEGLRSFVEQGGAVLIATDKKTEGEADAMLRDLAGVTVSGETLIIRLPAREDGTSLRYDDSEFCPFVEPIDGLMTANGSLGVLRMLASLLGTGDRPDLFRRGLQPSSPRLQVATNAPSRLRLERLARLWEIQQLAQLPRACELEKFKIPSQNFMDKGGPLFAVCGTIGKGRVLVLADHSIFINRMMLPREINNLEFAVNCLHWLRGGATTPLEMLGAAKSSDGLKRLTGQRNRVLFWDDGIVQRDFNVPLRKVSLPPTTPSEQAIVAAIDKTIAKLEDENYFNDELFAAMNDFPGGRLRFYRYAVYLLTLIAATLLAYRFLWRARHRAETAIPLLADAIGKHEPKATLLDQRRRELLRLGNLWEMGHRLAREFFESAGLPVTGASPPRVEIAQGGWRQRWRWGRSIDRLWRLARRDAPIPLSPAALQYRLRELEELKTALADGTIVLKAKINHG